MNLVLDFATIRLTVFTVSSQDKQDVPSDRVFADSLPVEHPNLHNYQSHVYASSFDSYGGHHGDVRRREDLRREYAPAAFSHSSAHSPYEPDGVGADWGFRAPGKLHIKFTRR